MDYRIPLLVVGLGVACRTAGPMDAMRALPAVQLRTLDSQSTDLSALIDGRAAVINLWASWCDACTAEWPALNRLASRIEKSDAVVIGIAVGETREVVTDYLSRHPSAFVHLLDEEFRFADVVGQKRVPTTLVVDRHGRVVYTGGAMDHEALAAFRRAASESREGTVARH